MILLTSAYLAPIHYYTKLFSPQSIVEERCDHYVKQTYRNRCIIAATHGALALTLPVESRSGAERTSKTPTRDIRLSDHGRWRELHWNALLSAYENSPYFEFYADDFERIYRAKHHFLVDFNAELQQLVLRFLNIVPQLRINDEQYWEHTEDTAQQVHDFRELIRPKVHYDFDTTFRPHPYYQVFQHRLGFLPNLSIVDLLFNMGPESRLVLRKSTISSIENS